MSLDAKKIKAAMDELCWCVTAATNKHPNHQAYGHHLENTVALIKVYDLYDEDGAVLLWTKALALSAKDKAPSAKDFSKMRDCFNMMKTSPNHSKLYKAATTKCFAYAEKAFNENALLVSGYLDSICLLDYIDEKDCQKLKSCHEKWKAQLLEECPMPDRGKVLSTLHDFNKHYKLH